MKISTIIILIFITLLNAQSIKRDNDFKLVAYFPVNGKISDMDEVDLSKLTHVIGAFIQSDINGDLKFPGWKYDPTKTSQEAEEEMLDSLIARAKRVGTIPMIALGTTYDGWQMTKNATARSNFISNIKQFIADKKLGGIDLDLEGWVNNSSSPFYPEEYGLLATELRDSLADSLILTSAVSAHVSHIENWNDDLISVLNWVNIMVYDIRVWNKENIANQSLFSDQVTAASLWLERGLTKDQIVFGVPFYSRGWDYDNVKPYIVDVCWSPNHQIDSSAWTWSQVSTFSYEMLRNKFTLNDNQDSVIVTQNDQMWIDDGWTAYKGTFNGILYYNGPETLIKKTNWAIDSGYGGMMIWELTGDIATDNAKSLLGTIARTIEGTTSVYNNSKTLFKNNIKLNLKNNKLEIIAPAGSYNVKILNLKGKVIKSYKRNINTNSIETLTLSKHDFASGQYLLKVNSLTNGDKCYKMFTLFN